MFNSRRLIIATIALLALAGCSRQRHRLRADRDAYRNVQRKSIGAPWASDGFTIETSPDSRLSHNSVLDDPRLPIPGPQLYAFEMPSLPTRDPGRMNASKIADDATPSVGKSLMRLPSDDVASDDVEQVHFLMERRIDSASEEHTISYDTLPTPLATSIDNNGTADSSVRTSTGPSVSAAAWESIPKNCLVRTLEFQSIRNEHLKTFGGGPGPDLIDTSARLTIEDLMDLALKHSRAYQTRKEQLYRAALRLSLEHYAYQLRFTPFGNGIGAAWENDRTGGLTEESLTADATATIEKITATGGTFLARFANSVVLTFNGPAGFATELGSEVFAELTQPLLQRDIVFERLTQAERNVVYAARDYARFRKQFFRDVASDYYDLLLTYRRIEIDMLDFFANQQGFEKARSEFRLLQKLPRFQVDQFEQNAIDSRGRLIGSCNQLEEGFDQLKLLIGIPPETPINLDLTELDAITARDEITVASELAERALRNLQDNRPSGADTGSADDRESVLNAATQLAQRLEELIQIQQTNDDLDPALESQHAAVTSIIRRLQVESAILDVEKSQQQMAAKVNSPTPLSAADMIPLRINQILTLLELGRLQHIAYGSGLAPQQYSAFYEQATAISAGLDEVYEPSDEGELEQTTVEERVDILNQRLAEVDTLNEKANQLLIAVESKLEMEHLDISSEVNLILDQGSQLLAQEIGGLIPITISVDEAMLTALVSRFDLMNQRGSLADTWRQIKLAGDDLRSILNLRASQSVFTDSNVNRPFDFTWDESETRVSLEFDAPLNRRAQRNEYRESLIDYDLALRNLMQVEDEIKFGIRSDLRNLQLAREQYAISVAGAALASDRRRSTRIQLDLAIGNITARDVLEAQQAYTRALSSVASRHIDYILDRIDLFLDLELLQVDANGFWEELYNEHYQPEPRFEPPPGSGPAYGCLPNHVLYSEKIRRINCVPFGKTSIVSDKGQTVDNMAEELPEADVSETKNPNSPGASVK